MQVKRPDKKAVIGESMTAEQLKNFLVTATQSRVFTDFDILLKAYRGMTADDFKRFIDLFIAEGHNINAHNKEGKSLLAIVQAHSSSTDYVSILQHAGAVWAASTVMPACF